MAAFAAMEDSDLPADRYGRALALGRIGLNDNAERIFRELIAEYPSITAFRIGQAEALFEDGIAEQAMARIREKGGHCWYACPLKALSNAKYAEFSDIFGTKNVGILTGDRKENPAAPIIVGTTEILRNRLYDAMYRGKSLDTDFVVLMKPIFWVIKIAVSSGRRS